MSGGVLVRVVFVQMVFVRGGFCPTPFQHASLLPIHSSKGTDNVIQLKFRSNAFKYILHLIILKNKYLHEYLQFESKACTFLKTFQILLHICLCKHCSN